MELYLTKYNDSELSIKKTGNMKKTNKFSKQFIFLDKPVNYNEFFEWFEKQFKYITSIKIDGIFKNKIIVNLNRFSFVKKQDKTEITISAELLNDSAFTNKLNILLEQFKKYKQNKMVAPSVEKLQSLEQNNNNNKEYSLDKNISKFLDFHLALININPLDKINLNILLNIIDTYMLPLTIDIFAYITEFYGLSELMINDLTQIKNKLSDLNTPKTTIIDYFITSLDSKLNNVQIEDSISFTKTSN